MSNYIDGSFFVPYFTCYFCLHFIKNEASLYCFVCMECCQGSSRVPVTTVLLPESVCKGRAFFRTAKLLQKKFSKKWRKNPLHHFLQSIYHKYCSFMIKYLRKRKFWREIKYLKFFKNNQRKQMRCRKKCREKRNTGAGQQAGIKKLCNVSFCTMRALHYLYRIIKKEYGKFRQLKISD